MKKILIMIALCAGVAFTAAAQNDPAYTNKRGVSLLPEAGDFALGFDATPFLQYTGNMFNNTVGNSVAFNGVDNLIYAKYFLTDNTALRFKVKLNFYNQLFKDEVRDDYRYQDPLNPNATAIDTHQINTNSLDFYAGYEWRRGRGRVQGFWGAEVGVGFTSGKSLYTYANPITAANTDPSTAGFGGNILTGTPMKRVTESKTGANFRGSAVGFIGVEYFFAPQISIGGEFNLGFQYQGRGQNEVTSEQWNANTQSIEVLTTRNRNINQLAGEAGLKTVVGGSLYLMFHF